jgi:hypothetical protein
MPEQLVIPDVATAPGKTPPRPDAHDPEVLQGVARKLCKTMGFKIPPTIHELKNQGLSDEQIEEAHEDAKESDDYGEYFDLIDILDEEYSWDGYALAKALDRKGWEIDASIVSDLDSAEHHRHYGVELAEQAWVKTYGLQPKYAQGDRVMLDYQVPEGSKSRFKKGVGVVAEVRANTLHYVVAVAELGHGEWKGSSKTTGLLLKEEQVLGLAEPEGATPPVE